jgi:hypothetical protein
MALGLPLEAGLGDADRGAVDPVWRGFAPRELAARRAEEAFDAGDRLARPPGAFARAPVCTDSAWPASTRPTASAGVGDAGPCAVAATTIAPAAATAGATSAARLTTLLSCPGLACRGFASACRPAFLFFACLP